MTARNGRVAAASQIRAADRNRKEMNAGVARKAQVVGSASYLQVGHRSLSTSRSDTCCMTTTRDSDFTIV